MGPRSKNFDPGQADQFFVACVRLGQPSLVWVWKISPKNNKFLILFHSGQKKSVRVESKSTGVKDLVGLLFTAGQKYALVRAHLY